MLGEIAIVGGVVGFVVGLLEVSHRVEGRPADPLTGEGAIRAAMEGPEGAAVRAEFRGRGTVPPERGPRHLGFGL